MMAVGVVFADYAGMLQSPLNGLQWATVMFGVGHEQSGD